MLQYLPVKENLFSLEFGPYISFGIHVFRVTSSGREELDFLSDISTDYAFVSALAGCCTQAQLDPVHLIDVVIDSLP